MRTSTSAFSDFFKHVTLSLNQIKLRCIFFFPLSFLALKNSNLGLFNSMLIEKENMNILSRLIENSHRVRRKPQEIPTWILHVEASRRYSDTHLAAKCESYLLE